MKYDISPLEISKHLDLLGEDLWPAKIALQEIKKAISDENIQETPFNVLREFLSKTDPYGAVDDAKNMKFHVGRIAYFVKHGIPEKDCYSISLSISKEGGVSVQEGRHRLAAAAIRGDNSISVTINNPSKKSHMIYDTINANTASRYTAPQNSE